jgi:Sec-independent protein secretion pathway component TatC
MAALSDLFQRLPGDPFDRVFLIIFLCGIVAVVLAYPWIAAEIPIHFDRALRPTRFVGKPLGPFVLPAVAAVVYGLAFPLVGLLHALGLSLLCGVVKTVHLALAVFLLVSNLIVSLGLLGI